MAHGQGSPEVLATGLGNPTAAAVNADGQVFVTTCRSAGKSAENAVFRIDKGEAVRVATGLRGPAGIVAYKKSLFVTDDTRILRIDSPGQTTEFVPATSFHDRCRLNAITVDPDSGVLYVTAYGHAASGGVIYRVNPAGKVTVVFRRQRQSDLPSIPDAVLTDGPIIYCWWTPTGDSFIELPWPTGPPPRLLTE